MNFIKQIIAITNMNLRTIPQRLGASLVIVIGMGGVAAVALSVFAVSNSLLRVVENSTRPERVSVISRDARFENASNLSRESVQAIIDTPGIQRDKDGNILATGDSTSFIPSTKKSDGLASIVPLRGVGKNYFAVHTETHLAEGRMFTPGLRELIVGRRVVEAYEGYDLNAEIRLPDGFWKIVGIFDSDGLSSSSAIGDADTLLSALRKNTFNSVTANIAPGNAAFTAFKDSLTSNPQLAVDAVTEGEMLKWQWAVMVNFFSVIGYSVGTVMSIGALFGALNMMYAAVSARTVEIGTLRAIGFGPMPAAIAILIECWMLALTGAILGSIIASLATNGTRQQVFQLTFDLQVTPGMIGLALLLALGVGFIGALFPAIRAVRMPVTTALQAR